MEIQKALFEYGLDNEESRLYLAALELGESSLAVIAKKADINRSTAYLVAKRLEQNGFLGSFRLRSGLKFVASPPFVLLKKLERKKNILHEILPTLNAMEKNAQNKPKITLYEGKEGYYTILEDSLRAEEKLIRNIGSLNKLYEIISRQYDDTYYIPSRLKNRIRFRGLFFADEVQNIFTTSRNSGELREIKFLPPQYTLPIYTMIYDNNVVMFTSKKELFALKIESVEIAQSEKSKFDLLWEIVK